MSDLPADYTPQRPKYQNPLVDRFVWFSVLSVDMVS